MVLLKPLFHGLALLAGVVSADSLSYSSEIPRYFERQPCSRRNLTAATVQNELGPLLSSGALIFGPENAAWQDATERWNTLARPTIQVVVQPALESDVSKIVKYCNANSIEFLARNRGHGQVSSLNAFNGLEIEFSQLRDITIKEGGKSALFQGGTYGGQVIQTLWDAGYVTTTGGTPCVGLMGVALGGGHGRYEGLYGLISDNFIHLNVVLADGSEVGVNATSHSDLWWAMKGAGHNFGIVTSVEKEIYPRGLDTWHFHNYVWSQDKLETVFEEMNKFHKSWNGTTPPRMGVNFGSIVINATYSETEAVLAWGFHYAGSAEEAEELLAPFNAIEALSSEQGDAPYPVVAGTTESDCVGGDIVTSTVMTQSYNITTERALYEQFNAKIAQYPELAPSALLWHEGYSTAAVQAIPSDSDAYPHREETHLMLFTTTIPEGSDLVDAAEAWAKEVWDMWNAGQPGRKPKTYVNYSLTHPYETLEATYGYEPWRLERLRALKAKYDRHNKFRYYVPIISEA
ncbi:putative FAD binding domain-containing protein [Rosellinia necatrix]|uniref:Putative FAD binding domain-containing protein n=1 Tax=Rosellinia necatrix TaxID=77044 RepID=A0A1W2TJ47_ROSNE|nr:putative FAD binding domain-containing protein [Rosellinia necatrix]